MGNFQPFGCVVYKKSDKLSKYLTRTQIKLIQDSWTILRDDVKKTGTIMFIRFFEIQPDMKRHFPKIIAVNDANELDYRIDNDRLQTHALTVMEGLGAAVESLEDTEFLNNVLFTIGRSHTKRRVKPVMLHKLWPALDFALQETLQDRYSKDVAEAWRRVFMYIKARMGDGMKHGETEVVEEAVQVDEGRLLRNGSSGKHMTPNSSETNFTSQFA